MLKFKCEICSKHHEFYDKIVMPEPDVIKEMDSEDYKKRVRKVDIFYLIDNSIVLTKGELSIEIQEEDKHISWEVWVLIPKNEFSEKMILLGKNYASFIGQLYQDIPFYENTKGLSIQLVYELDKVSEYPNVQILNKKSELAKSQNNGLTKKEVIDWMEQLYHSPKLV